MNKSRLESKVYKISDLKTSQVQEAFQLFARYYIDVSFEQFALDLREKSYIMMFYDREKIIGFSTLLRKKVASPASGVYLFSGDTVMDAQYWGSKILQETFFKLVYKLKLFNPFEPHYWMLMSKGYKTYLLLRKNFSHSFPRFDQETPKALQEVMDRFYEMKYGSSYSRNTGLICFDQPKGAVKGNIAVPTSEDLSNPHIAYFIQKNPDFRKGNELACIAEVRFSDYFWQILKRTYFKMTTHFFRWENAR